MDNDVCVLPGRPCPEAQSRGGWELMLIHCCDTHDVSAIGMQIYQVFSLLVVVVVHENQLRGPFVGLLAEFLDELLHLAPGNSRWDGGDAGNLRHHAVPMGGLQTRWCENCPCAAAKAGGQPTNRRLHWSPGRPSQLSAALPQSRARRDHTLLLRSARSVRAGQKALRQLTSLCGAPLRRLLGGCPPVGSLPGDAGPRLS